MTQYLLNDFMTMHILGSMGCLENTIEGTLGSWETFFGRHAAKSIFRKACFFALVATKGNIPMGDMLRRKNFSSASRCSTCLEKGEFVDHPLVRFRWVSSL